MNGKSEFKNLFSQHVFKHKYALTQSETWHQRAITIVDAVCGTNGGKEHPILSKEERDQLVEYITEFKFLPGGRYIYYAGREAKFYNNCFKKGTKVLTDNGWRNVEELGDALVFSPVEGNYLPATFNSHGVQQLQKITFAPVRGKSGITYTIEATKNHHWWLVDGSSTTDLQIGDVVPANTYYAGMRGKDTELGFAHGFIFGDGNSHGQLRLCADKDKAYLPRLSNIAKTITYPEFAKGDPVLYFNQDILWKNLPNTNNVDYIAGFIEGWLAADGSGDRILCSVNEEALLWFREYAPLAGLVISGELRSQIRDISIGGYEYKDHKIFIQNYSRGSAWAGFKVINIEQSTTEEVYCPYEPKHSHIVIDHGIDTGNCYLLRAEEDTREEWSDLVKRAMSCLMTGGGIGIDYSRLRASGRLLRRTGGIASGPIPLMYTVNEIGRNVMQGGSRRSAIYASLNWQHDDAEQFLRVKNWESIPVGKAKIVYEGMQDKYMQYTLKDAKRDDFNYPAPLDMTNISLNYDDEWLKSPLNPVFLENCKQAMSTGEPGFSFNFGEKENETLRNAPVSGNTRVLTSSGYRKVYDIVDTEIIVWTGKQWAKTVFKLTKENVETVEVSLSNGRKIVCDPEHPFIQWTKGGIFKTEAKFLSSGDAILATLPQEEHIIKSDYDYGYGFVYGDGSIRNGKGEISYWTDSKKACFDKACLQLDARILSVKNRAYFDSDFMHKEIIPSPGFVAGWFDADGSYARGLLRLSCKDKDNLYTLQEILDYWGITSVVREDGHSSYRPENKNYTLQIFKSSFSRFKELIPTIRLNVEIPKKVRTQNILVLGVVPTGVRENVYCCDVGVEEHAFMAEGVLVSNCTEVTSEDDSDVCNLGSINLGAIESLEEFKSIVSLASKFLVCGTIRAELPYDKVYKVREKNRRLGLGLMGIHEWLLKRGYKYEVTEELHKWLKVYRDESERAANEHCDRLYLSKPVAYRAIAPTGSIGILAATTTGIEPLFAIAYKRRYLTEGTKWKYEYVVDSVADSLIKQYGLDASKIETALDLAGDYERRIKFQADVQDYVDMSISSTINLPKWGGAENNEDKVSTFAQILAKYAPRLRGFTCYPSESRGGQPLTPVGYEDAKKHVGVVYEESDICEISGKGGTCGS